MDRVPETKAVVLIVEDDSNDEQAAITGLRNAGVEYPIEVCRDGEDAIVRISELGLSGIKLVLLDLKLPKRMGLEVLAYMQRTFGDSCPPTVVLSLSDEEADMSRAARLGAVEFVTKPLDYEAFLATMKTIARDWLEE